MPTCVAALLAGALLAHGAAALQVQEASTAGVQAELRASVWLDGQDGNPSMDKLASLKTADPNAYAVVQALLKKQMLGMLNMRHPSVGGGAAAFQAAMPNAGVHRLSGAAAFAKFEDAPVHPPPVVPRVELPYADIEEYATTDPEAQPAPSSNDFMNWKPGAAEDRDADLVNSVLGMASMTANLRGAPVVTKPVAALTATKSKGGSTGGFQLPPDTVSGLAADEDMFGLGDGQEPLPVQDSPAPVPNKAAATMGIPVINWVSPWKAEAQAPQAPPMAAAETAAVVEQAPAPTAPESHFPDAQASALESTDSAKALQGWLGTPHSGTMLVQETEDEEWKRSKSHATYESYLDSDPATDPLNAMQDRASSLHRLHME